MAVGSGALPELKPIAGVRLGTAKAHIKKPDRRDLVLIEVAEGSAVAGVFTQNAFCAAPVQLCKKHLAQTPTRWLVINTGYANAGTGERGLADATTVCQAVAESDSGESVLPFSTGVIGEPLPVDRIIAGIPAARAVLAENGWEDAANGIMTTDTRPKAACASGNGFTVTGISKGAGMIKPNMATMLAFVATDAEIDAESLQQMLNIATERSFNRITVDGDTSTNDACMLIASGRAGKVDSLEFQQVLNSVMQDLAHAIVRDAEGATKFVAVKVSGGLDAAECLQVAYAVAESPLVKTALFASDPNWGRILAAVGRAGLPDLHAEKVRLFVGDVLLAENGGTAESYTESAAQAVMDREDIEITIDLNRGDVSETVWTCDFSHDYVSINADYRS